MELSAAKYIFNVLFLLLVYILVHVFGHIHFGNVI